MAKKIVGNLVILSAKGMAELDIPFGVVYPEPEYLDDENNHESELNEKCLYFPADTKFCFIKATNEHPPGRYEVEFDLVEQKNEFSEPVSILFGVGNTAFTAMLIQVSSMERLERD
jgi:hypothetical protein